MANEVRSPVKRKSSSTENTDQIFAERIVLSSRQLLEYFPSRVTISRKVQMGELKKVGAGFYCQSKTPTKFAKWVALSRIPEVVIAGRSSLEIHGFLEKTKEEGDLIADVPLGMNIRNSLATYKKESNIEIFGVVEIHINGQLIRTYSRERTLAEIYLSRLTVVEKNRVFSKYLLSEVDWDRIKLISEHLKVPLFDDLSKFCSKKITSRKVLEVPSSLDYRQRIVNGCIVLLGRKGSTAISYDDVSHETGISLEIIRELYASLTEMQEAVYTALTNMLNEQFSCIKEGFRSKDEIVTFFKKLLLSARSDYMGYKIQRWAMAEESEIGRRVATYLSGAVVRGIADFIQRECPTVSRVDAEVRAYQALMVSDCFQNLRWFYGSVLDTQTSSTILLDRYEDFLISDVLTQALRVD